MEVLRQSLVSTIVCHHDPGIDRLLAEVLLEDDFAVSRIVSQSTDLKKMTQRIINVIQEAGNNLQLLIIGQRVDVRRICQTCRELAPNTRVCVIVSDYSQQKVAGLKDLGSDFVFDVSIVSRPDTLAATLRLIVCLEG